MPTTLQTVMFIVACLVCGIGGYLIAILIMRDKLSAALIEQQRLSIHIVERYEAEMAALRLFLDEWRRG